MTTGVAWRLVSNIDDGELKNWMLRHSKKKKLSVEIEFRAGGDPNKSEKLGLSVGSVLKKG